MSIRQRRTHPRRLHPNLPHLCLHLPALHCRLLHPHVFEHDKGLVGDLRPPLVNVDSLGNLDKMCVCCKYSTRQWATRD